ncbi:hypothetical protein Dimus_022547, partial [Dionaea muscipula]
ENSGIPRTVVKKAPSPKVFKVISEIRSNVDLEFFEGLTQLFPVSKTFSYAFPHESDSSVRITIPNGIAVAVKKISRKKKPSASSATSDVADVERIEAPSKGTVSNTQESEAVMKKGATRPRPKCLRKKHVISPAVGDNLLEIVEVSEEEEDEEETLVARRRRVLPKTTFDGSDERETESDKVTRKGGGQIKRRRQKQEARTGPFKRPRKSKSPAKDVLPSDSEAVREDEDKEEEKIEENPSERASGSDVAIDTGDEEGEDKLEKDEDEDEDVGQRDGKGLVEVEKEADAEEEEEEDDGDEQPITKKYHLGVLAWRRLTIPHSKMVARYADILLGSSNRGARRYLSSLPPSHELALVMRNVAENERLNNELTSEKARLTELATAAMQLKADVARVTNEK